MSDLAVELGLPENFEQVVDSIVDDQEKEGMIECDLTDGNTSIYSKFWTESGF